MMTGDDFRTATLDMDGAIEGQHMGHPDFRANGRIFATLNANEDLGMVKVSPDEQRELIRAHPKVFTPAAGAWGRQGSTMVDLRAASKSVVRSAVLLAWQNVMSLPRKNAVKKASRHR